MTERIDDASLPLEGAEPNTHVADDEHRVQCGEGEVAFGGGSVGDDEETVVAAGSQARDGPHRVAAGAVEPLSPGRLVEVTADRGAELDGHCRILL